MGSFWSSPESEEDQGADSLARFGRNMDLENQLRKLKNPRVTILDAILKEKAKLHERLVTENNAILGAFLTSFIEEMKKQDRLFESLFQKIYYTGSFFIGLRVAKPDEFDLNLVLKMPKAHIVTYHPQVPSYAKFQSTDERSIAENGLAKLFDNSYLMPCKVRMWIQSVVDKALRSYKLPHQIRKIHCSESGPARTLILEKWNDDFIDIDFVPAIECSLNQKPPGIENRVYNRVKDNLQCFLVPKPYAPAKQAPVNEKERSRLWRTHYPEAEKIIMHDFGCVKNVIKLLKLLRDKENWKVLASYYLKTILMWMIIENPSKDFWKQDKMGDRFMEALKKLASYFENKKIPYFFSSNYNLLKISDEHSTNIQNRLRAIIKDIEKDYDNLGKIFNCVPNY